MLLETTGAGRLLFLAKDALVGPTPGGPDDPRSVGAVFVVTSGTGETATLSLPAAQWTANATGTVFRYRNPLAPGGPSAVDTVVLKRGSRLKVTAKATGVTLDEPTQGSIALALTSGSRRWRARFGGTILRDQPGRFLARNAPPPIRC